MTTPALFEQTNTNNVSIGDGIIAGNIQKYKYTLTCIDKFKAPALQRVKGDEILYQFSHSTQLSQNENSITIHNLIFQTQESCFCYLQFVVGPDFPKTSVLD